MTETLPVHVDYFGHIEHGDEADEDWLLGYALKRGFCEDWMRHPQMGLINRESWSSKMAVGLCTCSKSVSPTNFQYLMMSTFYFVLVH